ncbi:MAG TPA: hypothetical protein VJZ04_07000 [Lachnospiraceae bacterium]|nr:hypothetical protein [Lachnospiraceae bacterium]
MNSYQNNQNSNQNLDEHNCYINRSMKETANSFAAVSLLMGITTIVTMILGPVYLPCVFGGLSIIFAILSKDNKKELHSTAVVGLITGIIGLVLNTIFIVSIIVMVLTIPSMREQFNTNFEQIFGESFEDASESLTGNPQNDAENMDGRVIYDR